MGAVNSAPPALVDCEDVTWVRDQPATARGAAAALGRRIGLGEHRTSELVLAVAELATNMDKHSEDGSLVLRVLRTPQVAGVEVLVVDQGPGIADLPAALRDGTSTAGTLGIGLGAVRRLADTFDIHSRPGLGTVQLARFWPRPTPCSLDAEPSVGGITRPISGETACGDAWAARADDQTHPTPATPYTAGDHKPARKAEAFDWAAVTSPRLPAGSTTPAKAERTGTDRLRTAGRSALVRSATPGPGKAMLVMSCDGLGHGPIAALAGQAAVQALRTSTARTPEEAMQHVHQALRGTRGAAVAIARIEADGRVLFCGVGNITAAIVTDSTRANLLSHPGIVGHQMRSLRTYELQLPPHAALILHSDGLSDRWTPGDLAGLLAHRPAVIAAGLLRLAGTRRDDASVVVARGPR
ncbi:ATP-binding SpoIIE family protein phosphatase [Streptomyces sp. NPDC091219]|uniref:ATP-binding SpoIIE family protein phosphatase n=1 Tax=Streptomyces sp. NPDC091219 TaxID=3155193 RepID=UPI00344B0FE1